jgi:type I restriction enzyme, S subunit
MTTTLGSHISTLKGFAFKSQWYCQTGTPIVRVSDFSDDAVDTTNLNYIPEEMAIEYERYRLTTGDVVIQTVGSWPNNPQSVVGKAIRVPSEASGALLNQNAVRLDPTEGLDKTFLFYLLRNSLFKNYIVGCAQGAASQASITLEAIRNFTFELPPFSIQRKIADVLSAYDDLIEVNARRIRVLEAMAQSVYREWFGNVDAKSLPRGWAIKELQDTELSIIDGDREKTILQKVNLAKKVTVCS